MTLVVTGATGHLGRLVVEALLGMGVPAGDIVATGRRTAQITDLAERGVRVEQADFTDPESLDRAFAGAERVLLVSGNEMGSRFTQHRNAIDAAQRQGVGLVAYTSIANADRNSMQLAGEHRATEIALMGSGLPYTLLRNSWYLENYTAQIPNYLQHGAVLGSAGTGRVSAATRADYAAAAAVVLSGEGHAGATYELGGEEAFTLAELAAAVSAAAGQPVSYVDLPPAELTRVLVQAGLPEPYATVLADADLGLGRGELLVTTGQLHQLIGRPATTMTQAVAAAISG